MLKYKYKKKSYIPTMYQNFAQIRKVIRNYTYDTTPNSLTHTLKKNSIHIQLFFIKEQNGNRKNVNQQNR